MKSNQKNLFLTLSAAALVGVPVALAASCSTSSSSSTRPIIEPTKIEAKAKNLEEITVSGDTAHPIFSVPTELTNINENKVLNAAGKTAALKVYGRTTLADLVTTGEGASKKSLTNTTFMPLKLLEYYLASKLEYETVGTNTRLMAIDGTEKIDVNQKFGSLFGFNLENYKPTLLGKWVPQSFEVRYYPEEGYTTADTLELEKTAVPKTANVKTFFNINQVSAKAAFSTTNFEYAPTSTHDAVVWNKKPSTSVLPTDFSEVVSGFTYSTDPENQNPQNDIPVAFNYQRAERKLYLQLSAKTDFVLAKNMIDVTEASQVQNIVTKVDKFPGFETNDLSKITISVAPKQLFFAPYQSGDINIANQDQLILPSEGAVVVYQIGNNPNWIPGYNLVSELQKLTSAAPVTIKAKFDALNNKDFFIENNRLATVTNNFISQVDTQKFINDASKLAVNDATSTISQINFKNVPVLAPELSAVVEPIEYLLGDYASPDEANNASIWSTSLPTSVPKSAFKFYARIRPKTPTSSVLTNMLIELTDTSGIKSVLLPTNTANIETALRTIRVTGQNVKPVWTSVPTATDIANNQVAKVEYLVSDVATVPLAAKAEGWNAALPPMLDFSFTKRHLFARIFPKDGYRVINEIIDLTATSAIQAVPSYYKFDAEILTATLNSAFEYDPISNHANVTWTKSASYDTLLADWKTAVTSIKFSLNADGSNSTTTVPKAFDFQNNLRKLYVVLIPGNNITLSQSIVDVTMGSGIQELRTRLDDTPDYLTNDLSTIRLAINPVTSTSLPAVSGEAVLYVPTALKIPVGAEVKYLINAETALYTAAELITKLETTRPESKTTIKARFVVTDSSKYAIENNKEVAITNDVMSFVNTSDFIASAASLKTTDNSSLPSNIAFENIPTLPTELSAAIAKIEYLIGDYATVVAANEATSWSQILPTSSTASNNQLYMRLTPNTGYILQSTIANLTVSSGLISIPTIANTTALETYLKAIKVSGTHDQLNFTLPVGDQPQSTQIEKVEYLLGNYASIEVAKGETNWVETLPPSTLFEPASRFLYARIVPKAGFIVKDNYLDLTATSGIQNVKGKIDVLPGFSAVDLSKIMLSGDLSNVAFNTSQVTLPSQSEIRYQYDGGELLNEADFKALLLSLVGTITQSDFSKITASLISKDVNKYVLNDPKTAIVDTLNLADVITDPAPEALISDFAKLKVASDSTSESVFWENLPALDQGVTRYEFLSGNYATVVLANAAPSTFWSATLPKTVDFVQSSRFFYARLVPKIGHVFSNGTVDLTTSSNVRSLTTDVTARHNALRSLLSTISATAGSVHNAVTWNPIDTSSYAPFFTIEYLSSTTVTTPNGALAATTGYSNLLPNTLDFTHNLRYLYARLAIKPGMVSNETKLIVDMSSAARLVKSDIAFAPGFSAMDLAKIQISGGLVNAVISSSTAGVLAMVNPGYTMNGITGYLSATNFIAYLKNNFGTIQQSDLSTIRVKAMINDPGKYVNTVDTIWTPNVTDLKLVVEKQVPAALRTAIEAMRVSGNTLAATWNPGLPSITAYNNPTYGVKRLEIAISSGPDRLFDSIQGANDTAAWQTTLKSDAGVHNTNLRYMYVRVVPLDGYVFTDLDNAIIDVTTTSGLRNLTINVTDNHIAAITEINALVASTSSVHNAVVWSVPGAPALNKTFRLYYEFLYSNTVSTLDAAKLEPAASWGQLLPTSVDPVHANRHLYAKITIAPGGFSTNPNLYLDLSAKVQAIKTNDDALTGFDQIDLSKITIKGALIDATIVEAPANLISAGVAVTYAITDKTPYMTKAAFISYLRTYFTAITAEDIANITAKLAVSDSTKYVLTNIKLARPDTSMLKLLKNIDVPAFTLAALSALKVTSSSDINAVLWNNDKPIALDEVLTIQYLSGNYATPAEVATAPEEMWQNALPTSVAFDSTKRFLYAKMTPKPGYEFNQSIYELTTSSEIRTLLEDVSSRHSSLLVELAKIAPESSATHLNTTWVVPSLAMFEPYFEVQYLSSTKIKTLAGALASTTDWTSALPTTLDYTHADRHLFARLILKPGYKSTRTVFGVDLSTQAQSVKTDLNEIVTSATADPSKILVTGYYVDANVNPTAVQLPTGADLRYDITALSGVTNLTAAELITYLKDHVGDITLAVRNSITGYVAFDTTKFILTNIPRGLVDVTNLKTPKPYDSSVLIYQLQSTELKAGSINNNLAWNNAVTSFSAPTASVEYYVGTEATELEVSLLTDSLWSATLPTTLPSALLTAPENAKLWVRIKSQVGYVANTIYADLTTSSRITSAIKSTPQAVKDALPAALQGVMTHPASDVNTAVHYTIKNLDASLTPYVKLQFLQGNFTTEAEAKAATSWVDRADYIAPTSLVFTHTNRPHIWARIISLIAFDPVASYVDLTPVVVDVLSDISNATDYQNFNLSKLVVVLNSLTSAPVIEETAIGLPRITGTGYEFSYKQLSGVDVWQTEAAFIADATTNAAALRALTSVKVRLVNLNTSKYYLAPADNKATVATIDFRYDRVWSYIFRLFDSEATNSAVGNFTFFSPPPYKAMTKSAVSNFSTNMPGITSSIFSNSGGATFSIPLTTGAEIRFTSTEYYDSVRTRFSGAGGLNATSYAKDIDINPNLSYMLVTGDYTKTQKKLIIERVAYDPGTYFIHLWMKLAV